MIWHSRGVRERINGYARCAVILTWDVSINASRRRQRSAAVVSVIAVPSGFITIQGCWRTRSSSVSAVIPCQRALANTRLAGIRLSIYQESGFCRMNRLGHLCICLRASGPNRGMRSSGLKCDDGIVRIRWLAEKAAGCRSSIRAVDTLLADDILQWEARVRKLHIAEVKTRRGKVGMGWRATTTRQRGQSAVWRQCRCTEDPAALGKK